MTNFKQYKQFTYIAEYNGKIFHRFVDENNNKGEEYIDFKPTLYEASNYDTGYKDIYGNDLAPIKFKDIWHAREICKSADKPIHGQRTWHNQFIRHKYPGEIDFDVENLTIANIDIETFISDPDNPGQNGLISPIKAVNRITAISIEVNNRFVVFGSKEFTDELPSGCKHVYCEDESKLLDSFLKFWNKLNPDMVTGWNIDRFDIPYLVGRINKILGDGASHRLSPAGVKNRMDGVSAKVFDGGCDVELFGITTYDYMKLYKKYIVAPRERYSLNYIAYVELGDEKIDYSEFENLDDLYENDYNKYIIYNIHDTRIVKRLDEKLNLFALVCVFTYMMKMPHEDAVNQVPSWDAFIYNKLADDNIVIPQKVKKNKSSAFVGAYVLPVIAGLHKWVVSADLNSLYPSLIRTFNIGPETLVQESQLTDLEDSGNKNATVLLDNFNSTKGTLDLKIDDLVEGHSSDVIEAAKALGYCIAGNGAMFDQSKQSFLSQMMEKLYNERRADKNTMLYHQAEVEKIKMELATR